ncbi:hypothetical protein SEA_FENRY_31 [Gordonia phage Fenry]|nr:hypothetical protein SEA_FENRY_31 [Gordonia phage Fenry]
MGGGVERIGSAIDRQNAPAPRTVCSMQNEEANKLQRAWEAKGNPPCDHKDFETEYYLGTRTGDVACKQCGLQWPKGQTPD